MKKIIERIREVMEKKGITAAEISRRSGIDRSSLSHYLSGDYKPKTENLKKIADALGVTLSYLVGLSDDPAPTDDKELNDFLDAFTRMTQPGSFGDVSISQEELQLVLAYRDADPAIQSAVRKILDMEKAQ